MSGWWVDTVVALHLRNAADYRLPTFGPHGTKLGLGVVIGCRGDPVVALHLRNAADYRLPTFGPHGTKLGHS